MIGQSVMYGLVIRKPEQLVALSTYNVLNYNFRVLNSMPDSGKPAWTPLFFILKLRADSYNKAGAQHIWLGFENVLEYSMF